MEIYASEHAIQSAALGKMLTEHRQYSYVSNYLRAKFPRLPNDTIFEATHHGISKWYEGAPAHVHSCPVKSRGWIVQVAQRSLSREIRRERRFIELPTYDGPLDGGTFAIAPNNLKHDEFSGILGSLSLEKLFETLTAAVAETMQLHVLEGYTVSEAATIQNCSKDTIKKRLKQGYAQLREVIRKEKCIW